MPQRKLLSDANIYFAVGNHLDPILGQSFCEENYALYLCDNFYDEFQRSNRLIQKFEWVDELPYRDTRRQLNLSRKDKKQVALKVKEIAEWQDEYRQLCDEPDNEPALDPKEADRQILATAKVSGVILVTDDTGLQELADFFEVETWTLFKLFRVMLNCDYVSAAKLAELGMIIAYVDKGDRWHRAFLNAFPEADLQPEQIA